MDVSIEDDDHAIEILTPVKKKKMKQAQLPFQMLNVSNSSIKTDNVSNKKRKTTSPLSGCKSPKVLKLTKEKSTKISFQNKVEDVKPKLNTSDDSIKIIEDEPKDQQKLLDSTNKNSSFVKSRKLEKSQKESGGNLTKFLKKVDKESRNDTDYDNNSQKLEDKCEIPDVQSIDSTPHSTSQLNGKLENVSVTNKSMECSISQESDSDIAILSSDNETSNELDKSIPNEETNDKSVTPTTPQSSKDTMKNLKKLTPKQVERRQEMARRKEEKEKLKMEKEKKREEEKANRRKEREEKQREKEEKEKLEKEQKKKEKELKELKKQMEIELKHKEKEAKEEERRKREEAKEEEKRKKEEEKLEVERKKQKAASNFASFFVSKKQEIKSTGEEDVIDVKNFMPFEVKADMKIAPVCRRTLSKHEKLLFDEKYNIVEASNSESYLEDIKLGRIIPRSSCKTWPFETKDEVILLDEDNDGSSNIITETHLLDKHRPKLLQFSDNRRPPYWGTWRKKSNVINPRRPFSKDKKWFDYEVDSDDEWEEEEPGESLKGSDDEKDEENSEENEYDVDNEFMVPHGYLSDEEARADEEDMEDMSPQTQKMKLKVLGEQFEAERNTKMHRLQPKIIGCLWQGVDNSFSESTPMKVKDFLSLRQAWFNYTSIVLPSPSSLENETSVSTESKTSMQQHIGRSTKKTKFPDEALPDLIRLVHGNTCGRRFLMREFMTFWSKNNGSAEKHFSKVSIMQKIKELANRIACPEEGPMHLKVCWYIPENIRKQYLCEDVSLPNRWTYNLTPNRKGDIQDAAEKTEKDEKEKEKKSVPLITQFTKKITQEELKKQLIVNLDKIPVAKTDELPLPKPPQHRPPKRATLISVARGEQFPKKSQRSTLTKFVGLGKEKEDQSSSEQIHVDSNHVVFVESNNKKAINQTLLSSDKSIEEEILDA